MDRRRAGLAVALLLAAGLARAATQGPPVYAYTGAAPSGSCTGTRVWIDALGTGTYYCNAGTWAAVSAGGGGAPTTAQYWTGAADGTLSAEKNLGALATGLVLNTAGVPSAYGGAACTLPQLMQNLSASGAPTCFQLRLDQLANPSGDKTFTFPSGAKTLWEFSGATDFAFSIHGTGAFTGTGDLVHFHMQGTASAASSDVLHLEFEDADVTGLRVTGTGAASQSITTDGKITAGGLVAAPAGFIGPLTGAVTGNASTATALAADPTNCSAGQAPLGVDASGNVQGCFTPGGGGGGSPGGSSGQLQYNNAAAFGGISRVTTDGSDLVFTGTATPPSAPAAGSLKLWAAQPHGASGPVMPFWIGGATQVDYRVFPEVLSSDPVWGCLQPAAYGSTTITPAGSVQAGGATGTAASVAWAATDERTRAKWVQYPTTAAINLNAGLRANADYMWRGNSAGLGGFYWWGSINLVTANAGQRVFIGLKDATAVLTATADPSAALDTVYFGCNAADTNLSICSNDNSGAATCTTLGANFPCKTANTAYDVALWAAPNAASISYYIRRLVNGSSATGTVSSDLPRNTVTLGFDFNINSGSTAAIATMQFGGTCYIGNP